MTSVHVSIDKQQIEQLQAALEGTKRKIEREVQTAINATARKVQLEAARALAKEITIKVSSIKKLIKQKSKATKDRLQAVVRLGKGYPVPLKYYRATATKKGVTYKVDRRVDRKSIIRDAFMVKQYGNNVYRRKTEQRYPLEKQYGPVPGDFYERAGIVPASIKLAREELKRQIDRRIRFIRLEAAGHLRGKRN